MTKTLMFLDKDGWPVETVKGRWIQNFLRRLLLTRKVRRVNEEEAMARCNKRMERTDWYGEPWEEREAALRSILRACQPAARGHESTCMNRGIENDGSCPACAPPQVDFRDGAEVAAQGTDGLRDALMKIMSKDWCKSGLRKNLDAAIASRDAALKASVREETLKEAVDELRRQVSAHQRGERTVTLNCAIDAIMALAHTEKAAQPDICPTCGSDGPRRRMAGDPLDFSAHDEYCNDDWHFKAQPAKASQPQVSEIPVRQCPCDPETGRRDPGCVHCIPLPKQTEGKQP